MTLAADALLTSEMKIVDLALEWGYESPEAFTRAYQNFHGVPPSITRKLGVYNMCDRITCKINIQGGHVRMGTKPIVRIEEHSGTKVVSFTSSKAGAEGEARETMMPC